MKKLNDKPARTDLTDRECTKILGGTIGALVEMADRHTVQDAVRWWAELSEEHWSTMFPTDISGAMLAYAAKADDKGNSGDKEP